MYFGSVIHCKYTTDTISTQVLVIGNRALKPDLNDNEDSAIVYGDKALYTAPVILELE